MGKFVLEKNLERFDFYIEKADNKASFILALASALIAAVLLELGNITIYKECIIIFSLLVILAVILFSTSIILSLKVLIPRSGSSNLKSCLYFSDVANMEQRDYKDKVSLIDSEEKITKELIYETKQLAEICQIKMKTIRNSLFCLSLGIACILIIIFMKVLSIQS